MIDTCVQHQKDTIPVPTAISVTERSYTLETLIHRHPYAQVVLPDRGRLDLMIEGQPGAVAGTGYAIVAPETEHICWADRPTRCLVIDLSRPLLAAASVSGHDDWSDAPFRPITPRTRALTHLLRVESEAGGLHDPLVAEALGRYAVKALTASERTSALPVSSSPSVRLLARLFARRSGTSPMRFRAVVWSGSNAFPLQS